MANFTEDGKKDSKIWVTDQKQSKQWQASPSAIAYENKLYALENNDDTSAFEEINAIEDAFALLESMAAPIIKQIIKTEQIPTRDGFNILINFIALMASRTPRRINHRTQPLVDISEIMMEMNLSTKERWLNLTSRMIVDGMLPPESFQKQDINYDKLREFFKSKQYTMTVNQNYKIKLLLDSIDILIPLLAKRKWSLLISKDMTTTMPELGGFICSDNPVALISLDPLPPIHSPGFGMLRTEVTIPLSKNVALIGRFEGKETVTAISVKGMAAFNSRTGMYADRFCYHSNKNFILINQQQKIGNANDFLEYCKLDCNNIPN